MMAADCVVSENSHTTRHLSEFWMIEPELAFADINDDMRCAEDYVRYCCQYLLDNHRDELEVFEKVTRCSSTGADGGARC